ncbi:MAG: hypothetical protein IT379_35190 [Deltaproteobacteria bacterium]|nr:hypothetical protein [Deltaproteobacteria bacterium]
MRSNPWVLGVALAMLLGCSDDAPLASIDATVIEESPGLGARLDTVRVLLLRTDDGREVTRHEQAPVYAGTTFGPVVVRLAPERQQDAGRVVYRVRAEGVSAGEVVVVAQHRLVFVPGRRIVVPLRLGRSCLRAMCEGATTCIAGACVDDEIPPCTLEGAAGSDFCRDERLDGGRFRDADLDAADAFDAADAMGSDMADMAMPDAADMAMPTPLDMATPDVRDMATPDAADMATPDVRDMATPDAGEPSCVCDDDGLPCTVEQCVDGLCVSDALPDGASCGAGGLVCCGGACVSPASDPAHCGGCGVACPPARPACSAGGCLACARDSDCADDGFACTDVRCDVPTRTCVHETRPGLCLIEGTCVADGATHPTNECLACDASADASAWTELDLTPCNDGLWCTEVDYCSFGFCTGTGRACSDGLTCTLDQCNDTLDRCENPLAPDRCLIGGACYATNVQNPAAGCQWCQPTISTTTWTNRVGACQDGFRCTSASGMGAGDDVCMSGMCVGVMRGCEDSFACTTDMCIEATGLCSNVVVAGQCLAGGDCRDEGEVSGVNPCLACVTASSQTMWTNICDGG